MTLNLLLQSFKPCARVIPSIQINNAINQAKEEKLPGSSFSQSILIVGILSKLSFAIIEHEVDEIKNEK